MPSSGQGKILAQEEEYKHLGVLFPIEGKTKPEIDSQTMEASAVT